MSARAPATAPAQQPQLPLGLLEEDPAYLTRQLVTYIGNKRALLGLIRSAVEDVRRRTEQDKLRILDAFSGSGVVSRMLKQYASELVVNDTEDYARVISECYLANRGSTPTDVLAATVGALNRAVEAGSAIAGAHKAPVCAARRGRHRARGPGLLHARERRSPRQLPAAPGG